MNTLIGTYECKVDAKGRLMLPVAFKKQLASVMEKGFVLKACRFSAMFRIVSNARVGVDDAKY